jgi:prohibitin 2
MEKIGQLVGQLTKSGAPLALGLGGAYGVYYCGTRAMFNVDPGHKALKYNRLTGVGSTRLEEGINFMIPWFERPIIFDVRARQNTTTSLTGTKDLQMVNISLRALIKPNQLGLPEIYRSLGTSDKWEEILMPSIVNEVLKSVVAQYNASQLISQREMVSRQVRERLSQRAAEFNVALDDVAITHINFSPEYEKAVESKQVALQNAERAKNLVTLAQQEKERIKIHAEGEAQTIKMIGESMKNNPGFVEMRRIDKAREVAALLSKSNNRMVLSTDSLLLNLMNTSSSVATTNMAADSKKK